MIDDSYYVGAISFSDKIAQRFNILDDKDHEEIFMMATIHIKSENYVYSFIPKMDRIIQ